LNSTLPISGYVISYIKKEDVLWFKK
jgi:hypothetical protein